MPEIEERQATIKPGEVFRASFQEAATAGYQWSVEASPPLDFQKTRTPALRAGRLAIGAPLGVTFSALVMESGAYDITFRHQRPWAPQDPGETVHYTLRVEP